MGRFQKDRIGNADLADIVHRSCIKNYVHKFLRHRYLLSNPLAVKAHSPEVVCRGLILIFCSHGEPVYGVEVCGFYPYIGILKPLICRLELEGSLMDHTFQGFVVIPEKISVFLNLHKVLNAKR